MSPVVFALGAYRNPSISFTQYTPEGNVPQQDRAPLFVASMRSLSDVVSQPQFLEPKVLTILIQLDGFLTDYPAAKARADDLDDTILNAAGNISDSLKDLVSLATRQVMGATELTIANGTDSQWNKTDVKMFMKDIGDSKYICDCLLTITAYLTY